MSTIPITLLRMMVRGKKIGPLIPNDWENA